MNTKEVLMAELLANSLKHPEIIVVDVRALMQTKAALILLKALADINRMRGLVVTLERPHHYLTYLLGMQGISQRNLTYLDLAHSKHKKVNFPIKISKRNREIIGGFIREDTISLKNFDFVMIDNLSSAKTHMSRESIIETLHLLVNEAKNNKFSLLLPIDCSRERKILNSIHYDEKINFEEVIANAN